MDPDRRAQRLAEAHLYFVCDAARPDAELQALLDGALGGGADIIQLRDKEADASRLLAAASIFRACADAHGALFILNDRPELAAACNADGVHVGQTDAGVAAARAAAGAGTLVGLSTHSPHQLEAACASEGPARPDYISVGPVWETPTKPGRPAAGLDYVRYASRAATLPWFAIGSIDVDNVAEVVAAAAERIVVVRAIRDAADPEEAARRLRTAVTAGAEVVAR